MLRYLSIRDFVIVDELELAFSPGFSVLTGETGAGKSILVDALSLLLGARGDAVVIRGGAERADLTAEFAIECLPEVREWLSENEFGSDACLLRRVIDSGGRSRAFVNGRPVLLTQLRELAEGLVEIHGQNAHQSLTKEAFQRQLLDGFGGLSESAREVAQAYRTWQEAKRARIECENNAQTFSAERERLEAQVDEIKALNFSLTEWEQLKADQIRLAHAANLIEGVESGLEALAENENACLSQLNRVLSRISQLSQYDPALEQARMLLESAQIDASEAARSLRRYSDGLDLDPRRLVEVERRLQAIHTCARKYRVKPEELRDLHAGWQHRVAELGDAEDLEELRRREADAETFYCKRAAGLSAGRKRASRELSEQVTAFMQKLAMSGGRFAVALFGLEDGNSGGMERIEFQVAAHQGLALAPLAKAASGGELSRVSLALQAVANQVAAVPTLVFDEVDAGIGGRVAEIVGDLLRRLGRERQVLCVTHLPQVAAAADHQWRVEKRPANGSIVSRIALLGAEERVEEIARMLGGVKITETTRKHAAEMLSLKREKRK
jgi:DNA repair protein RecN (Recombination protein N)